ncbi:MAG TPA: SufD family Fe-S cluster assembly protein [Solirubrobacteraceae bacterium]|jgi:Fe-S cluster assembly protein SufD|nr:SufD family Fe-S cluster assembly protein [Solirubrobacteraceae bacterium]
MSDAGSEVAAKPGRHREATLYRALDGDGAPAGLSLAEHRDAARALFEQLELPVWRRSGFWTTSLAEIDLGAMRAHRGDAVPSIVTDTVGGLRRAGLIVQNGSATVHAEIDPTLAARGVILCSLERAASEHPELFARYYAKRLPYDRDKLSAGNGAFWSGGAFLYVPPDVQIEAPFDIVYSLDRGHTAQYARTLAIGDHHCELRLREWDLAGDDLDGPCVHAGAFELYLEDGARARLAHVQDWNPRHPTPGHRGEVADVSTHVVHVGRDAYCHWLPCILGGRLTRQHAELVISEPGGDMAFRGLFFAERAEHLDLFAVDLHETGPSGGDVHWRGAASGESRASFEGLIKINPGAQQSHTYLQIHTMMLSKAARLDAIPSVLVSADDVSASHGGTVGELDEDLIFYMRSRGLDRATAVRTIVEGFFEPLITELQDPELEAIVRARVTARLEHAAGDIEAYVTAR